MSTRRKEQVKNLKGPDQFQVQMMTLLDWVTKNYKIFVGILVPLIVVVIGVFIWGEIQEGRQNERLVELGKVHMIYAKAEQEAEDQRRELRDQINEIDEKMASMQMEGQGEDEANAKPDPQLEARKNELKEQIEKITPNYDKAQDGYRAFYEAHPQTPEGWMAGMTAANLLIDKGSFGEAIGILEGIMASAKDVPFYQLQSRLVLVGVMEEQGKFDEALAILDEVEGDVPADLKPRILLTKGRVLLLKDAREEAKAAFAKLIQDHGTTPEASKARSLQMVLN